MCCGRTSEKHRCRPCTQWKMLPLQPVSLSSAESLWPDRSRHTHKSTLHFTPHPQGSQYLPTQQTLIPLLSLLQTHPLQSFCRENAAWWSGTYRSGPWWLVQGPRRRAGSSGAPGPGAKKRLQRGPEVVYVFISCRWFEKTVDVAQSWETGSSRDYTFTMKRQMGSCVSLSFISSVSV